MVYSALSDSTTISQFTRRKKIHVNSSADGELTDFQIKLTIAYESAMQADFNDVRFSELDGSYIYHWIESKTDSTTANVWIKTDVPASDGKDIYMYYDNPILYSGNDIGNTFLFGDDFSDRTGGTAKTLISQDALENSPFESHMYSQAIHYDNTYDRTYIVYYSHTHEHKIIYYDHDSKTWATPVKVADGYEDEIHEHSSFTIDNDGYIYVFYNDHANMKVKKSTNVENISTWGSAIDPTDGYATYPKAFVDSSNNIYLLHMHHVSNSSDKMAFTKSTDHGATWATETLIIDVTSAVMSAYVFKALMDSDEHIHVGWTHNDTIGSGGLRKNVYYIKSEDHGVTWKEADGTSISLPVTELTADKAFDSGVEYCQGFDLVLDENNYPIMTYSVDYVYGVVRWNGTSWVSNSLGITTNDHTDSFALQVINSTTYHGWLFDDAAIAGRGGELQIWETTTNGTSWEKIEDVTSDSTLLHRNVIIPKDYHDDVEAIWNYGGWDVGEDTYNCDILFYGDGNPNSYNVSMDKWDIFTRGVSSATGTDGIVTLSIGANDYDAVFIQSKSNVSANNIIFEYYGYMNGLRYGSIGIGNMTHIKVSSIDPSGSTYFHRWDTDRDCVLYEMATDTRTTLKSDCDIPARYTWVRQSIYYTDAGLLGHKFDSYDNNVTDTTYLSTDKNVFLGQGQALSNGGDLELGWVLVRKYTANEPTTSVGTEQHQRRIPQFV